MEIEKEFVSKQHTLLAISNGDYNAEIIDSLKQLSGKSVCYVTLNKTHQALQEIFIKNKIDMENIVIIDAISKTIKTTQKIEDNIYFVSSPGALTELSLAINKFLDYDFEYLIFDSLNSLLVYQKVSIVKKWVSSIINKIKESNTRAIFYTLNLDEQKDLIKETSMFVDKVVNVNGGKSKQAQVQALTGELQDKTKSSKPIKSAQ
jgi:hypothetical protein